MIEISSEEIDIFADWDKLVSSFCDLSNSRYRPLTYKRINNILRCGKKSNIPFCCRLFYIFIWQPTFVFINFPIVKSFIYWYPSKKVNGKRYNYVPCFFCYVMGRYRELHVCNETVPECCVNCRY